MKEAGESCCQPSLCSLASLPALPTHSCSFACRSACVCACVPVVGRRLAGFVRSWHSFGLLAVAKNSNKERLSKEKEIQRAERLVVRPPYLAVGDPHRRCLALPVGPVRLRRGPRVPRRPRALYSWFRCSSFAFGAAASVLCLRAVLVPALGRICGYLSLIWVVIGRQSEMAVGEKEGGRLSHAGCG
jgi:hypothetical protein